MSSNIVICNQEQKQKCRKHPHLFSELICLDANAKDRVVCFNCAQRQQIPFSNLISMSYVLSADQNVILEAYPPLKNQVLSDRLSDVSSQQQIKEITAYFAQLREDIEKEVKAAEERATESLRKQEIIIQKLLEGYQTIAEIEKLKGLIVSEKESAEKDLDDFIKEKWNKAEENRTIMEDLINQIEAEYYFSSDEPNKIALEIIQNIQNINFFHQSIQQVNLMKSTKNNSQQMEITKVDDSIYQIKQAVYNSIFDQVFLDPIIDPLKKYILHIELEMNAGNSNNQFFFGLIKDEGKNSLIAHEQNMCYWDQQNSYGITKYIKGSPMQSGTKVTGRHSFEVRIHLNQKVLRVANLPDYSSIAELDDSNKIDPKVAYRFFLSMINQGDMMRIDNIRTVSKFDEKM